MEDTDRERSTEAAVQVIFDGLAWLGLEADETPVFQASRADRHVKAVDEMLARGSAYRDYMTPDELEAERTNARAEGRVVRSPWRDASPNDAPDRPFVVRLKAPIEGETVIDDQVKGRVVFQNKDLDDLILLRTDGTPTYNLAVVVDDHEMGVTHVIRGDDHLNNAARQTLIYQGLGWTPAGLGAPADDPRPRRRQAVQAPRRPGGEPGSPTWAICPRPCATTWPSWAGATATTRSSPTSRRKSWFDIKDVVGAPARLDWAKLNHLNNHYIRTGRTRRGWPPPWWPRSNKSRDFPLATTTIWRC